MAAFQAHAWPGTIESEGLGFGDAGGVFCQGVGEGVDGFHRVQALLDALTQCLRRMT